MNRNIFFACTIMACALTFISVETKAQKTAIPMDPANWQYDTAKTAFAQHLGVPAIIGKNSKSKVYLKNKMFSTGTIEFDVDLIGLGFPGIEFRMSPDQKNGDNFYIRSFADFNPLMRTTLQYASIIDGLSMWDIMDEYQSGATLHPTGWNHVKLVISANQMKAYVNDMQRPALVVPQLEGGQTTGGIGLTGNVAYANLTFNQGATEGLGDAPGFDLMYNDTRFLRNWQYTDPVNLPVGREPIIKIPSFFMATVKPETPDSTTAWKPIQAGPRAMVNLSTLFGTAPKGQERRLCWLKTTIHADSTQDRMLSLGFSDEVWVLINGQFLYADKNCFATPNQKDPKGRATIENTQFKLPLKKGDNELIIGLANYLYGWALVARLDINDGIRY